MKDASLPLQAAIVSALKSDAALRALISDRVYDRVPQPVTAPWISLGPSQSVDESTACHGLCTCFVQVDCWSEAVGYPEVKRMAAAAVSALNQALSVQGFAIVIHRVEGLSYQREADGLTSRAIIRLRYDLQAAA